MEQVTPMMMAGGSRSFAKLLLYSPRQYNDQVIRPYIYSFDENAVGTLLEKGDTLTKSYDRADVKNSETIAQSLLPDPQGTPVNMRNFDNVWTFTLVISRHNNYQGGAFSVAGGQIIVMKGHCLDEPVAPTTIYMSTPIINKDCHLLVHTREVYNDDMSIGNAYGLNQALEVVATEDIVDASLDVSCDNKNMFKMTPYDVLTNYAIEGNQVVNGSATCMLSALKKREPIHQSLKSPGLHMRQILNGLDAQIEFGKDQMYSPKGIGTDSIGILSDPWDPDNFKQGVCNRFSQFAMSEGIGIGTIDAGNVFTIEEIDQAYPDLQVIPQMIASMPQMDILPQSCVTPQTQYSSMCASAIQAIASDCGLSGISFQFQSYDPANRNNLDKSSQAVVPDSCFLTCPPSDQDTYNKILVAAVNMFMNRFKQEVVPFIVGTCGHFFIQATYTTNSETLVKLRLLDHTSTFYDAWTETPNRLGMFSSTSIGNAEEFEGNAAQLNSFVLQVNGSVNANALGRPAFDGLRPPTFNPVEGVFPGVC